MFKKILFIVLSAGLLFSAFPVGVSAGSGEKADSGKDYEAVRLDSPQAMAQAIGKSVSKKNLKRIRSREYGNYENEVRRRVIFKGDRPKDVYGAKKVYYYSVGNFYILEYVSPEMAAEAVERMRAESPDALILQDQAVRQEKHDHIVATSSDDGNDYENTGNYNRQSYWNTKKKKAGSQDSIDGIRQMGLDNLKNAAERNPAGWRGRNGKITVAVIDSGINRNHPWLRNRIDTATSVNLALDYPNQPEKYDDLVGHGSHVSGIIAKATPSNVKIMTVRVFNVLGKASILAITAGVDYAREHGADIINMSFGEKNSSDSERIFMGSAMQKAVSAGITLFAASGNDYSNVAYTLPANSAWTIAIGSVEPRAPLTEFVNGVMLPVYNGIYSGELVRSDFSNNGELIDFVGPGRYISSAWIGQPGAASGRISSGTSMATPHITAAAAMIKLKHPEYNQWDVYATLQDNTVDIGAPEKDLDTGHGYVDMMAYNSREVRAGKPHQAINTVVELYGNMNSLGRKTALKSTLTRGDGKIDYVSSNTSVVRMSGSDAIITGPGRCEVTATAQETARYAKSSRRINILITKGKQSIVLKKRRYKKSRKSKPFYLKARVAKPGDGKLTFKVAKKGIVKVNSRGKVRILRKGTVKVYARANETAGFYGAISKPILIKITKSKAGKAKKLHASRRKAGKRMKHIKKHVKRGKKHRKS